MFLLLLSTYIILDQINEERVEQDCDNEIVHEDLEM